jgi:hypothetical protein
MTKLVVALALAGAAVARLKHRGSFFSRTRINEVKMTLLY